MVNMVGGDGAVVICAKCENPRALPPFLAWEEALATETGDPRMMDGWDKAEEIFEGVTKSVVECN